MIHRIEDVRFEYADGDIQLFGVFLDHLPVGGAVAGIHHEKLKLEGHPAVAVQLLKELGHQHGILAAGNAHGDAVAALHQLVIAHGLREIAPQLFAELFAQAVFHALTQLVGLLTLHLIAQPFDIAAPETVCVDALLPQRLGRVQAELAVRAVEDELPSVRFGRIALQLFLRDGQRARNHAVIARLLVAHIDQYIVLRRKPPHFLNRNFHVRFLMLSSINCL